jgi:activating signal cointegrator complex subunit 1
MKPRAPPKTHFICLPLRSPAFRSKVATFNALLPDTISPTIIRPTGSLHFTLGVLSLVTSEEINSAVSFLHSCHSDAFSIVQGQKVTVSLKGIASMQKNFKKTGVIYAVPDESDGQLRSLCSISHIMNARLTRFIAVTV